MNSFFHFVPRALEHGGLRRSRRRSGVLLLRLCDLLRVRALLLFLGFLGRLGFRFGFARAFHGLDAYVVPLRVRLVRVVRSPFLRLPENVLDEEAVDLVFDGSGPLGPPPAPRGPVLLDGAADAERRRPRGYSEQFASAVVQTYFGRVLAPRIVGPTRRRALGLVGRRLVVVWRARLGPAAVVFVGGPARLARHIPRGPRRLVFRGTRVVGRIVVVVFRLWDAHLDRGGHGSRLGRDLTLRCPQVWWRREPPRGSAAARPRECVKRGGDAYRNGRRSLRTNTQQAAVHLRSRSRGATCDSLQQW
mmetsp:Transcript_3720/g.11518  ORF Transcript_3720/g.11518 Transcript_3720/m.11518 type:complete len:304 (+) Transcript_3720:254-1165(+)